MEGIKEGYTYEYIEDVPLKGVPVTELHLKRVDFNNDVSDYVYFSLLEVLPSEVIKQYLSYYKLLEDENGIVKVEKWLSNYIKKPNAFVKLYLKEVLSKVNMNRRLKEAIGMDLLIKLQASVEQPTRRYKLSSKRFPIKMNCNEILQDLVYITLMETVFNPEIEENAYSFVELTQMTKTRLDSLIDAQYELNFVYSDLFEKCYNAKEGLVSKELERYGWEYYTFFIKNKKYPIYENKWWVYLKVDYKKVLIDRLKDKEYINFRERDYKLYLDLCEKYDIYPLRSRTI